jgi:hypothetical protein
MKGVKNEEKYKAKVGSVHISFAMVDFIHNIRFISYHFFLCRQFFQILRHKSNNGIRWSG